jgi:hypothetical protein
VWKFEFKHTRRRRRGRRTSSARVALDSRGNAPDWASSLNALYKALALKAAVVYTAFCFVCCADIAA